MGNLAYGTNFGAALGRFANGANTGAAVGYSANGVFFGAAIGAGSYGAYHGAAVGRFANGAHFGAALGREANGSTNGVAVGYQAKGMTNGVAVGYQANGMNFGAAVGSWANGATAGASLGRSANGASSGAAVGWSAMGYNYGAAVGRSTTGANSGAALGYYANGESYGVAVGRSTKGYNYGVAVGYSANGAGNNVAIGNGATCLGGVDRIAIGSGVTNDLNYSTRVRGNLYLDGSGLFNQIYYRATFGSGGWTAKAFTINHPCDPQNKVLRHFCLEGPEVWNVYAGNAQLVNGVAVVELPDYYSALNLEGSEIYSLTPVGRAQVWIEKEAEGNLFAIAGDKDVKVSWTIKALRNDPACLDDLRRRPVEQRKSELAPGQIQAENASVNTWAVSR